MWSGIPIVCEKYKYRGMIQTASNRYRFQCEVVEVIHKDGSRMIKAVCNPGSIIIETPDVGNIQLGDKLTVTGTLQIDSIETNA